MVLAMAACSNSEEPAAEPAEDGSAEAASYNVGIIQLVEHPALDAATQGFKDALTEKLGDAVSFDENNAQGDSANCATIANSLVSANVDLILANATAPLQAAAAIDNVAQPAGVPIVAGEEGICAGCGVATLSIDYYDLGHAAGEMAVEILANGADVSTMPIQYAPAFTKEYDAARCEALGIEIPADYTAIGE